MITGQKRGVSQVTSSCPVPTVGDLSQEQRLLGTVLALALQQKNPGDLGGGGRVGGGGCGCGGELIGGGS